MAMNDWVEHPDDWIEHPWSAALAKKDAEIEQLKKLCVRAADALEEEFGSPEDPAYGIKGPIHELIAELRR
jgi:hypothetical protein